MKYELVNSEIDRITGQTILTVKELPGFFAGLLGYEREAYVTFVGNCTVWRRLPSMRRCIPRIESILYEFAKQAAGNQDA